MYYDHCKYLLIFIGFTIDYSLFLNRLIFGVFLCRLPRAMRPRIFEIAETEIQSKKSGNQYTGAFKLLPTSTVAA